MEILEKHPTTEPKKEEVKESREVRRMRERINEDANKTFVSLAEKFRICFMENDPDGQTVKEMKNQVCAKWVVYCKNRNLIPEAFKQVDQFCKDLMEQYSSEYINQLPNPVPHDTASPEPEPTN